MSQSYRVALALYAALFTIASGLPAAERTPLSRKRPNVVRSEKPAAPEPAAEVTVPELSAPYDLLVQGPEVQGQLAESSVYMRVAEARLRHAVNGAGLTAAVLDTGLRTTHSAFAGRIPAQRNFTTDYGGDVNNASDGHGHGTNVAGIICAASVHTGFAPGAAVIPIKVLTNSNSGQFSWSAQALDWVIANAATHNISVVNMSLGSAQNLQVEPSGDPNGLRIRIQTLRAMRIPVVIAAGNSFFSFASGEGMSYPAIVRESISVGAIFDHNIGRVDYASGATAFTTAAGRITPFSQRLHSSTNAATYTDTFATGAALTSAGITSDTGVSTMHGTSQAAPCVAGQILLGQELYLRETGQLPTVDDLERWLQASPYVNVDGDDEDDNVTNTNKTYLQADTLHFLDTIAEELNPSNPLPEITSPLVASATVTMPFTYQIVATNAPTSYNASSLPSGLNINTSTGVISGSVASTGVYNTLIRATNTHGSDVETLVLTVVPIPLQPPLITSALNVSALQGNPFQYTIVATNTPTAYNATNLPAGLYVNTSTGVISGTSQSAGTFPITITASNAAGSDSRTLTLQVTEVVLPSFPPRITSSLNVSAVQGEAFSYQIQATNSPSAYGASGLPSGVILTSNQTGLISGTPMSSGTYIATIWAVNNSGEDVRSLTITVTGPASCDCAMDCVMQASQEALKDLLPRPEKIPLPWEWLMTSAREFRDHVLQATPVGRQLASAYYEQSHELAWLVIRDPTRLHEVQSLLADLAPTLQQLNATGSGYLTTRNWQRGWKLTEDLLQAASPELQEELRRLQQFLTSHRTVEGDVVILQLAPAAEVAARRLSAPPHTSHPLAGWPLWLGCVITASGLATTGQLAVRRRSR